MKEFLEEADILEEYIESLAENPAATPPPGLDKKNALIARGLNTIAQNHPVIVRDSLEEIKNRVWQKTIASYQEERVVLPEPITIPPVKLKRSRFALTGLSLAACLALVILTVSFIFAVVPRTSTGQDAQNLNNANTTPVPEAFGNATAAAVAASLPDSGFKPGRVTSFDDGVVALAYSPDGKYLAVATTNKLYLQDTNGQTLKTFSSNNLKKLAWSPDSQFLVTLSRSGDTMSMVLRWNINEAANVAYSYTATDDPVVTDLAFSPDGQYLLTLSMDKGLRSWDMAGKMILNRVTGNDLFAVSPDGQEIMVSSLDGSLSYYKFQPLISGKKMTEAFQFGMTFTKDKTPLTGLAWTADSQTLAFCNKGGFSLMGKDGSFYKNKGLGNLMGTGCSFSPKGSFLVVGSSDGKLYPGQLKGNDFQALAPLSRHSSSITALAWSPDGKTLITGSADHSIVEWAVPVSAK